MEDVFRELTTDILVEEHHVKILEERALKNGTLETVVGGRMARSVEKAFHLADQWQCEESKDLALPRRSSSHQGAVARARPLGGHACGGSLDIDMNAGVR